MTRKRADGTDVTESGHEEICPVFCKEFADRGRCPAFAETAWPLFLVKGGNDTKYLMMDG